MTAVIEHDVADAVPPPPRSRRRRWIVLSLVAVVVLGLVGTGVGFLIYAHTYQPWFDDGAGGPARERHQHLAEIGDGLDQSYWSITGKPGTRATVDYVIRNTGSHSATLLGLPAQRSVYSPYITAVRWSNNNYNPGNGAMLGRFQDARDFPVTVVPGGFIFIQVTVLHPRCGRNYMAAVDDVPLRWSAMHVTHTWHLQLSTDGFSKPILACTPTSAHQQEF
jgi:hypothetical protein